MSKRILIVEDEPGILLSLKDEFEFEGYTVFTAEDGEEGLELARDQKPDLIILDIMLPLLDGYDVCKNLRSEGDNTPIIMLTVKDKEIDKILKDNTAQHSRKKLELYKPALLSNEPSYRKCHRVCGE